MNEKTDFEIVQAFGDLSPDTVIAEEGLARLFCRHAVSIRRAVERGELPPAVRLMGKPVWTVQCLRDHMTRRLDQAKTEKDKLDQKISRLGV